MHSRINQQLIAGRFGHEGLRQLRTKLTDTCLTNQIGFRTQPEANLCVCQFCTQLTKAFMAETSCNLLLINSATYLLTINSPTLKSIAMSLYDFTGVYCLQILSIFSIFPYQPQHGSLAMQD